MDILHTANPMPLPSLKSSLRAAEETVKSCKRDAKHAIDDKIKTLRHDKKEAAKPERKTIDREIKQLKKIRSNIHRAKINETKDFKDLLNKVERVLDETTNLKLQGHARSFEHSLKLTDQGVKQHLDTFIKGGEIAESIPRNRRLQQVTSHILNLKTTSAPPPTLHGIRSLKKTSNQLNKLEKKWLSESRKLFNTPQGKLWAAKSKMDSINSQVADFKQAVAAQRDAAINQIEKIPFGPAHQSHANRTELVDSVFRAITSDDLAEPDMQKRHRDVAANLQPIIDQWQQDPDPKVTKLVARLKKTQMELNTSTSTEKLSNGGSRLLMQNIGVGQWGPEKVNLGLEHSQLPSDRRADLLALVDLVTSDDWVAPQPETDAKLKEINQWTDASLGALKEAKRLLGNYVNT